MEDASQTLKTGLSLFFFQMHTRLNPLPIFIGMYFSLSSVFNNAYVEKRDDGADFEVIKYRFIVCGVTYPREITVFPARAENIVVGNKGFFFIHQNKGLVFQILEADPLPVGQSVVDRQN